MQASASPVDVWVAAQVATLSDDVRTLWRTVSDVLSYGVSIPVLVVAAGLAVRRGNARAPVVAALAGLLAFAVGAILKPAFARTRPDLATSTSWAFPSGHTATTGILLGVAWLLVVRGRPGARGALALVGCATALTGLARVLAGEHWLTDVLASGVLAALAVAWMAGLPGVKVNASAAPRIT